MDLPYELRDEFLRGNLVLFVGAGFTKNYLSEMPVWDDLLKRIFATLTGDPNEIYRYGDVVYDGNRRPVVPSGEYVRLAQKFSLAREKRNKELPPEDAIPSIHQQIQRELTRACTPSQSRQAAAGKTLDIAHELPIDTWITTNFDTFLDETVFRKGEQGNHVLARPIRNADFNRVNRARVLLKIHGTIATNYPEESIVITEDDYHRFLQQDRYIISKLYTIFCERTVVFVGYSLSDPNIQFIYNDVLFYQKNSGADAPISEVRPSYFLTPRQPTEEQRAYYRHKKIHYLNGEIEEFLAALHGYHQENEQRNRDLVAHINAHKADYEALLGAFSAATDPRDVEIPPTEYKDFIARYFDLLRIQEANTPKDAPRPDLDTQNLWQANYGLKKTILHWCHEEIVSGTTELLDCFLQHLAKFGAQRTYAYQDLINVTGGLLVQALKLDIESMLNQWCRLVNDYEDAFSDWADYTRCLKWYVLASRFIGQLGPPVQTEIAERLYGILRMCGRNHGESWYTTNAIYEVWPKFNPALWPVLEQRIRKDGVLDSKDEAILDHLRPGTDPRAFLPRV